MLRWRWIVRDWRRVVATGVSTLLAVTAFVVLTGSAQQSRLEVARTVDANFRSSYDILVRPKGSAVGIEKATSRVRPNYLSGLYGGITLEQADAVAKVAGVEVSAPIAMVGQVFQNVDVPVDVTDLVGESGPVLLRFATTETSMRGLATTSGPEGYLYVGSGVSLDLNVDDTPIVEQSGNGKPVPVCRDRGRPQSGGSPFDGAGRWQAQCWDRLQGSAGTRWPHGEGKFVIRVRFSFPVTVAAIDPVAEARLTGLDQAVVTGRYLTAQDTSSPGSAGVQVPVITSSRTLVDQVDTVQVQRLGQDAVAALRRGLTWEQARAMVRAAPAVSTETRTVTAQQAHRVWLSGEKGGRGPATISPSSFTLPGPVDYQQRAGGVLAPRTVGNPVSVWSNYVYVNLPFVPVPMAAADTGYRQIAAAQGNPRAKEFPSLEGYGTFDPDRLHASSALSQVSLETYQSPEVTGADAASRAALGGKPLAPDANPAGYVQNPPLVLTTLKALPALVQTSAFDWPSESRQPTAPVSAIRVRVAGVTGADAVSRERIRLTAERIATATGLDVDITVGSSPRPTTVALPATAHGAPALAVTENWVQKGVAATITTAIDQKSLALFVLILLTTALAVSISANASVRARRAELGMLACVGWRPATLTWHVLGELLIIGALAGTLGALIALPVGAVFGIPVPPGRALLAIPAAIILAFCAGLVPALRAARATPADAIRPAVTRTSRVRVRLRGPLSMAVNYVARTPARAITAAIALASGVAALTALTGIAVAFQGEVVGTLLGDAVSIQVRGADIAAAIVVTLIGLGSLLDILYLDLREQAARYASLQAAGWRDATLTRLITGQAFLIGAISGAALGLTAVAALTPLTAPVITVAVAIVTAGILATCLLAQLPARRLRVLPTAHLLSQE